MLNMLKLFIPFNMSKKNYVGRHEYNYNRAHQLNMLDVMKLHHIKLI